MPFSGTGRDGCGLTISVQPPLRAPMVQHFSSIPNAKKATILARSGRLERGVGWQPWVTFVKRQMAGAVAASVVSSPRSS
jgi:hypothetical protein